MTPATLFVAVIFAVWASATSEVVRQSFDPSVFGAASASASAASRAASARAIAPCSKGGAACDPTCRKTGICIQSGTAFQFRETADCGDLYCNPDSGAGASVCSDSHGSCVPNTDEIGCDATGVFPDLYDCHNALECVQGEVARSVRICDDDLAYDACTGYCDVHLPSKTCKAQTAICKTPGQMDNIPYNDRLYYYCVQDLNGMLHPVVGRCERGFFDPSTFSCSASQEAGCDGPKGDDDCDDDLCSSTTWSTYYR